MSINGNGFNDNHVTAVVGFKVEDTVQNLGSVQEQINKMNQTSKNLANSFSNVEKALQNLGKLNGSSSNDLSNNSKKINSEIREEAKQTTLRLKAELNQRARDDKQAKEIELNELRSLSASIKNEEAKELAQFKADQQIRVTERRNALKTQQRDEKLSSEEIARSRARAVKQASSQFNLMTQSYKDALNKMKDDSQEFNNITNLGLKNTSNNGVFTRQLSYAVMQVTGVKTLLNQFATVSKDIVEINKNAINVQRIMGDTTSETANKLTDSAFKIASSTSTIVTDVQNIQSSWVRINDAYASNLSLLEQITDKTAKFINVGEITDAEQAVSLLNSSILQFKMYTENADGSLNIDMDEVDATLNKWAYMADKTAMGTADEFGESLSKIGGYMELLGGDIDDAIVMTSILGDRLAKTGDEAGNSLKTITAYLTRDKTLNLFKDLGLDTEEFNNSLMKTNTKFEEFSVIMENLSGAYNEAIAEGNDVVAKQIQNAIGATRQADASVALLKNWSQDSKKYYSMIKEAEEGSYLDEQNEALMKSFSAQWQQLVTAITEFANTIATSGLLNDIQSIMSGLTELFNTLSNADPIVVGAITKLGEFSVALVALKKVLQMTGVWDNFKAGFNYGTVEMRKQAEELMKHKLAVLEDQQALNQLERTKSKFQTDASFRTALITQQKNLAEQSIALNELNSKYKEGTITAQQYIDAVNKLVIVENEETNQTQQDTIANTAHIQSVRQEVEATVQQGLSEGGRISNYLNKLGNGFKVLGSTIVSSLKSPFLWITLITTGVSYLYSIIKSFNPDSKIEKFSDKLEGTKTEIGDINSQLEDTNSKIKEINDNDSLTLVQQEELDKLRDTRDELEASIELKKKLAQEQEKDLAKATISAVDKYDFKSLKTGLDAYSEDPKKIEAEIALLEDKGEYITNSQQKRLEALKKVANGDRTFLLEEAQNLQGYLDTLNGLEYYDSDDVNNTVKELQDLLTQINDVTSTNSEKFNNFINSESMKDVKNEILGIASAGELTVDKLKDFSEVQDFIDKTGISAEQLVKEFDSLADSTNAVTNSFEITDITEFSKGLTDKLKEISSLDETMQKIANKELSSNDMIDLINTYEGFYQVANAGSQEQIQWLQKYKAEKQQAYNTSLEEQELQLLTEQKTLMEQIASLRSSTDGSIIDGEAYITAKENLDSVNASLEKIRSLEKINIEFDVGDIVSQLGSITSGIDDLVEAQNKLAEGTSLSKAELWDLCQTYPELLYQANLFTTTEAGNQKNMIDAIANMKEQEYDNNIDLMIANLNAKVEQSNAEIRTEQEKMTTLARIKFLSTKTDADYSKQLAEAITDYENQTVQNHQQAEQGKVDITNQSTNSQKNQYGTMNKIMAQMFNQNKNNKIEAEDVGNTQSLQSVSSFLQKYTNGVANRLSSLFGSIATKFKNAITGNKDTKVGGTGGLGGSTVTTSKGHTIAFDGSGYTIDNESISKWADNQTQIVQHTISEIQQTKQGYLNAISNLEQLKGMSIGEVSNTYGANSPDRQTGSSKKNAKDKDTTDSIVNELVSSIESLQDRLVKALKAQYQEMYDARVKLLKQEQEQQIEVHNERIKQLQAEIDKLKGETIEDKEGDLRKVKQQYNEWLKDDSSTGKGKQKELKDKIDDLENDIAIDKLEKQVDAENDAIDKINNKFSELLDEDSPNFDAELKALSNKMTDKELYDEANNLIRNQQLATIVDLINRYDPDYSGVATLMGQTAGQIIADEVATAMANYQAYKSGNYTTSSTSSNSASSNSTSGPANKDVVTVKKNDSLWKLAQQYYGDGSKWTKIQQANNGINPNSLRIGQQLVIPFSTGGYTGNDEGLAYLHKKERVLTAEQTESFDKFVNSYLPKIDARFNKTSYGDNITNNNVEFNKELVSVNIDKVINNTQADIENNNDNLDRMFRKSLQKSGLNFNK